MLSLLDSMGQPGLWTHESQAHIWLISGLFQSHGGLHWTLDIPRRVEWEANCMLVSSATRRVPGKQALFGHPALVWPVAALQRLHSLLV